MKEYQDEEINQIERMTDFDIDGAEITFDLGFSATKEELEKLRSILLELDR